MIRFFAVGAVLLLAGLGTIAQGQGSAPPSLSSKLKADSSPTATPKPVKPAPEKRATATPNPGASPAPAPTPAQEIVTEIYADKTVFDSTKSIGVFTGHIVVIDPRFQIQGDKLTIYIAKAPAEGLEKAVVEGNVGVVRDRPDPAGGPPSRMLGRSDKAIYIEKTGNFELSGNPRVQQGLNTHVSTSPETVMVLNNNGELQTSGPSRTEIRQPPKSETTPTPTPAAASKPAPTPTPKP
ncbi:MAG TPA: LptA/OstA family protein [Chthoniobacterales bacterium]|nr:LptA/OstA family protein [Chthoniobacterales bacterium]